MPDDDESDSGEERADVVLLQKHWVHSQEEDTGDKTVFRPAGYDLPPSRGRAAFRLDADNTFVDSGIGKTDIGSVRSGRWHLEEKGPFQVRLDFDDADSEMLEIDEVTPDKLTVIRAKED